MKISTDPRHNARRAVVGSMFSGLFVAEGQSSGAELMTAELFGLTEHNTEHTLASKITNGINTHKKEIDEVIMQCATDWPIDKIAKVDLILLRIAVYELLFDNEVPDKVVIDEAVELAKEFGGDSTSKFVNGVLGTVIEIKKKVNIR